MSRLQAGPPAFARQVRCLPRATAGPSALRVPREWSAFSGNLDTISHSRAPPDLNGGLYESWRRGREGLHSNTRRKEELIVRRFCLYRRRSQPQFFVPSPDSTFARRRPYTRPVIVEPEQIATHVNSRRQAAEAEITRRCMSRWDGVATVLLYTSGLRSGELLRLAVEDLEDAGSVLRIVEAKFHKSRLIPLSETAQMQRASGISSSARSSPQTRPERGPLPFQPLWRKHPPLQCLGAASPHRSAIRGCRCA